MGKNILETGAFVRLSSQCQCIGMYGVELWYFIPCLHGRWSKVCFKLLHIAPKIVYGCCFTHRYTTSTVALMYPRRSHRPTHSPEYHLLTESRKLLHSVNITASRHLGDWGRYRLGGKAITCPNSSRLEPTLINGFHVTLTRTELFAPVIFIDALSSEVHEREVNGSSRDHRYSIVL